MKHIVNLPLSSQPDVLFGLQLTDLLWIFVAAAVDLLLWRTIKHQLLLLWAGWLAASSAGVALAVVRLDEEALPQRLWQWFHFWISPRLYLP